LWLWFIVRPMEAIEKHSGWWLTLLQTTPWRPASPPVSPQLGQSVTPKQLMFDDSSGVDAATVGEVGYPPGFGPVQMDPSTPPPSGC
jgi:hypothetical protein